MKVTTSENVCLDLSDFTSENRTDRLNVDANIFNGNIELVVNQGVDSVKLIIEPITARYIAEQLMSEARYYGGEE